MKKLLMGVTAALFLSTALVGSINDAQASGDSVKPPAQKWTFQGLFGTLDRAAMQRGFQVYNEVCAGCHSLRLVAYRNLMDIGFTEDQVKTIAAEKEVTDGPNDEGEMFDRPARPSDKFVSPFPNVQAARSANNGAFPPDLSLIVKARVGGADYLHALLTGYKEEPPKGVKLAENMAYNVYFTGHQIAMPSPLSDDGVEYADKTKATVAQMSQDVTTFLAWASEPEMEERKRLGVKAILFLIVFTGMLYALKRKIWADIKH
jgi:ubiquinol-cytochrome c reductase cytochrome c1 subunit